MEKVILMLGFILSYSLGHTQEVDCFFQFRMLHERKVNQLMLSDKFSLNLDELNRNISQEDIALLEAVGAETRKNIVGCRYSGKSLVDVAGNELTIDQMEAEFMIINFNDLYSDACTRELDSLVFTQKNQGGLVAIVAIFPNSKTEIQSLIEKYGKTITFVADSRDYIEAHNLGQGSALNYLLDHRKHILWVSRHFSPAEINSFLIKIE